MNGVERDVVKALIHAADAFVDLGRYGDAVDMLAVAADRLQGLPDDPEENDNGPF